MSTPIKVLVVGATGRTGMSVAPFFNTDKGKAVTALTRESSLGKPENQKLKDRGVQVVAADLLGPKERLVDVLTGIDIVISATFWRNLFDQIPLAEAAKEAGVKRFVPCSFMTPSPRGAMRMYDWKDDILAAIQRVYLPWTSIDVGWWSEQVVPSIPSGRTQKYQSPYFEKIPGDGTMPVALTALADIGNYVAKIIVDPRTLNKKVFAYTDVHTYHEVHDLMERLSGEKTARSYVPASEVKQKIDEAEETLSKDPKNDAALMQLFFFQYQNNLGIRGDNTPAKAKIFGYLDFKELYPDVKGETVSELFQKILNGQDKDSLYYLWK
ncbi:hypothetical protein JX265_007301 [Neoarthrinium moseri]|uniref:NmrA-like domain-containing protein n=1 Tax=Neoarthrinium moseri TaxID=1658444 RepID=A0A9Q0ANM6_9PEZI|nr:uncharacterized protein JN550_009026 [Neoarthrinium moseri]KAI1850976.1 hypothetical protein JX266_003641 [Neoarthrinium moseri]KAI1864006.1 hypothetical protein JN550_009026 [Neoarthrinium moseri]KAI1867499.1 hypothetical protein JX265_007301 [Neoarthrinium moseri]